MNMAGSVQKMQQMNKKLDQVTDTLKETTAHVGEVMQVLKQLIKERVEIGVYNDLLTHPNPVIREITQEYIKAHEQKV